LDGITEINLPVLLIHEIAHAVTDSAHGKKWRIRMEKAAEKARNVGELDIANLIYEELAGYDKGINICADHVYGSIEDAVLDVPDASFDKIIELVRRRFGLTKEELLSRYKRSKEVFIIAKESYRKV